MLHDGQIILDRYTVERTLAHGGMATVYVVKHNQLKSQHALKVLDLPTANIRSRLLQEGRIQASLRHPNIVSVTDALEVEGHPALVMEFIDGPSLAELLEQYGAPDLQTAEAWFVAIVSAVAYAHERGLIHRDLKPDNVLMAPHEGGYLVKVTDFGIAKVVQEYMDERSEGVKTRTGVGMGTPAYMPPEQVTNAGHVDHRADIFALGCILYEVTTGKRAFAGDNLLSLYNAVADADYPPPTDIVADLPERFVRAINGCLQPELSHRIGSCAELIKVLTGEQLGPPPSRAERSSRSSRSTKRSEPSVSAPRRRLWPIVLISTLLLGLIAVVSVVGVLMAGGLLWSLQPTPTATAPTPTPTTSTPQPWTLDWPSAMHLFEVSLNGYRKERHLEKGVMSYDASSAEMSLYIFDVTVVYLGDSVHMPAAPWALVEADGTSHDADAACNLSLPNPVNPFRTYNQGERVSGPLCFEAPTNATGMRLRFKPDPIHGDSFWFDVD